MSLGVCFHLWQVHRGLRVQYSPRPGEGTTMDHTQLENQMVLSHHVSAEDLLCKSPLQKQQMILTSEPPLHPQRNSKEGKWAVFTKIKPQSDLAGPVLESWSCPYP